MARTDSLSLGVSRNKRHFVDGAGKPFFWLGDTIWPLFTGYTYEEAAWYLEKRKSQGFTVEHTMIIWDYGTGKPDDPVPNPNPEGELPWLNGNPAAPNPKYFEYADRIVDLAGKLGFVLGIMPCGGSSGTYMEKHRIITAGNVRPWAKWLANRYRKASHVIWFNGGDLKPEHGEPIWREFAAGIREGEGGSHLMSLHPCGGFSSSYYHRESWLDFNSIQTWADYDRIRPLVRTDYGLDPVKPVVHVEGAYEEGTEYPTGPITAHKVRKQAYWALLGGAGHTYGHNAVWRKLPSWREAVDAPGANQLSVARRVLSARRWWEYAPDASVVEGECAALARGGSVIAYLSEPGPVRVRLEKPAAAMTGTWINPADGTEVAIRDVAAALAGRFTPPDGWEDAILSLDAGRV